MKDTLPYLHHASHVLTLWFSDPKFLGPDGAPRPLPRQGTEESVEALTQRVDSRLDASDVVRLLVHGKALRRIGDRYVPRERALVLNYLGQASLLMRNPQALQSPFYPLAPEWFQWPLLEAAIEGNIVADFPLCNKSFNCSYSGHDL